MECFAWEDVKDIQSGEVFTFHGRRYKLNKKTSSAISISRYYWFDAIGDWMWRKLGRV